MSFINYDPASVGIKIDAGNAKPGVSIRNDSALLHLTQNATADSINGVAFTATAHMKATLDSWEEAQTFQIGFIQICRSNQWSIQYAGRTSNEGSITLNPQEPPAMLSKVLLDSDKSFSPFTHGVTGRWKTDGGVISATTGDHPAGKVRLKLTNQSNSADNYLFRVIDDREFWTVFAILYPNGMRVYPAHFHWQVKRDVVFGWSSGKASVTSSDSFFRILQNAKNGPSDAAAVQVLQNATGPQYNDEAKKSLFSSIVGPQNANRQDASRWVPGSGITSSFWS